MPTIAERLEGCLLGLAVGDGLGARFEGMAPEYIRARYATPSQLIDNPPNNELWYTDDTQMAIGVTEALLADGEIREETLCDAFVGNYAPNRGYGYGARLVLEAMTEGADYRHVARTHFPGGSFGNGAAMRVAPVGVFFRHDLDRVWHEAGKSAAPTHTHPLGVEGAQLLAIAVALAAGAEILNQYDFFAELVARCETDEYRQRLEQAAQTCHADDLIQLGNGIQAHRSVPTAIACFALHAQQYEAVVGSAIFLGGDTDTIAAMAGAMSGAYLGADAIPATLVAILEDEEKGRTYLRELALALSCRPPTGR